MFFLLTCLALSLVVSCGGTKPGASPTTALSEAKIELARAIEVKLLEGQLPMVEITLNGHTGLRFLVDSGASISLVEKQQAGELGFNLRPYSSVGGASGSGGNVVSFDSYVTAQPMVIKGLEVCGARLPAIDSDLLRRLKVVGVLGQDLLGRLVLVFDMHERKLHILPAATDFEGIQAYLLDKELALGTWAVRAYDTRPCPFVELEIDGLDEVTEMEIDSGATHSSMPGPAIEAMGLEPAGVIESEGVGGAHLEPTYNLVDYQLLNFSINCEIKRSPLDFGLLGMDILGEFVFVLDGPGQKLWLHHREMQKLEADLDSRAPATGE